MMMDVAKARRIAVVVLLLVIGVGGTAICLNHAASAVAGTEDSYPEGAYADSYGREIVAVEVGGKPPDVKAPAADVPLPNIAAGINSLLNVPAFDWSYGCSATSAAMLFGYYDRTDYSNMYAGPTNGGVCPLDNSIWGETVYPNVTCAECPLSATHQGVDGRAIKGHVDDYWIDADNPGPDPYVGNWAEHVQGDCTGDFMGTNQSKYANVDGGTSFYYPTNGDPLYDFTGAEPADIDGCHGMKDFAVSRGYSVQTNFNQLIQGQGSDAAKGFTFIQYVAEIDAGRPVLIHVEGHTMLGYGYNTAGNIVYLRDTWDHSGHQMTWGGTYEGMQHYGVTVIRLSNVVTTTIGTSGLVTSHPATVRYVQAGVSKTATTYGTWSGDVDYGSTVSIDNTVAISSTERYSTNAATSWTATQTATYTVPYYHQFKPAISVSAAGTGHTDLGITNSATLTYYRFGTAGTFNVFDAQSFNNWVDMGSTVSLPSTSSASTSAHRWYASGITSWTVNDAGSHSITYWEQFKSSISVVTSGNGHTDLNATNSATLTYRRFGSAGTYNLFDGQSFNDWADSGSTATLSNTSSASSSTHRWYCSGTASWAVNDASSRVATYWEQFKPTISVVTAGAGHTDLSDSNYAVLDYHSFGSAGTFDVFDSQIFNYWVDMGSTASVPSLSSASTSTHRWYTPETTSWVISDASARSVTYWEQFKTVVSAVTDGIGHADLNDTNSATLTYSRYGTTGTMSVFDGQDFDDWLDTGSTASLSDISSASTSTHRWYCSGTASWAVNDVSPRYVTYWEQCQLTVSVVPSYATTASGSGWYDKGQSVTLVVPDATYSVGSVRYVFVGWNVGGGEVNDRSISVNLNSPQLAEATYIAQYHLDVRSVRGNPQGAGWHNSGSEVSVSVESPIGTIVRQVFAGWNGDSSANTREATVLMDGPKTVEALWRTDYTQLYILIAALLVVALGVVAIIILVLGRRRHTRLQMEQPGRDA